VQVPVRREGGAGTGGRSGIRPAAGTQHRLAVTLNYATGQPAQAEPLAGMGARPQAAQRPAGKCRIVPGRKVTRRKTARGSSYSYRAVIFPRLPRPSIDRATGKSGKGRTGGHRYPGAQSRLGSDVPVKLPQQRVVIEVFAPGGFKESIAGRLVATEQEVAAADVIAKGQRR